MKFSILALTLLVGNAFGAPASNSSPSLELTERQAGTALVQLGFLIGYNYPFVTSNPIAAQEILNLLPRVLAYGLARTASEFQVNCLAPMDTQASLGYITTVAITRVPADLVETLQLDIKIPNSPLYNNPDELVNVFAGQINPAIFIVN